VVQQDHERRTRRVRLALHRVRGVPGTGDATHKFKPETTLVSFQVRVCRRSLSEVNDLGYSTASLDLTVAALGEDGRWFTLQDRS